jgi:5-methylcytosine-specific restriction endonuclease McrA
MITTHLQPQRRFSAARISILLNPPIRQCDHCYGVATVGNLCLYHWQSENGNYKPGWKINQAKLVAFRLAKRGERYGLTPKQAKIHPMAILKFFEVYDYRCLACGATENITFDHIIPLSRGGRNRFRNLQPLCAFCNNAKGNRIIDYRVNPPIGEV